MERDTRGAIGFGERERGEEIFCIFFFFSQLKKIKKHYAWFCACIAMPGEHSVFTDVILGVVRERHQAFLLYTLVKPRNLMVQETQHLFY